MREEVIKLAKRKRMTNKEKAFRAEIKKKMQEEGTLPPDKPRLNRKKYVEEARTEWNERDRDCLIWDYYLTDAIAFMLGKFDKDLRVSSKAVGVAKCLKLAIRLREFSDKLKEEGRTTYTALEQFEFIKDIIDA